MTDSISARLTELGLQLPEAAAPVAAYVPAVEHQGLLYISGQLPFREDGSLITGRLGEDYDVSHGYEAAERCGVMLIAQMKNQDPTSPTDMAQYMSQFAQLSSVEQAIQTNAKLDSLLSSNALDQAEGLIGRTASFTTSDGESTTGKITAVRIIQGGAVATLDNGVEVQLGPGITIS